MDGRDDLARDQVSDTSAYKIRRYPRELVDYLRAHGRRKVLFGSNHPAWPAKDCLEDFERLSLDEATAALFLHANAARVFKIDNEPLPAVPARQSP